MKNQTQISADNIIRARKRQSNSDRRLVVPLTRRQSAYFNRIDQWPTLRTFLPLTTGAQLNALRGAVAVTWYRDEHGTRCDCYTLVAIVRPTREELARHGIDRATAAKRLRLVQSAIARHERVCRNINRDFDVIQKHGTPREKAVAATDIKTVFGKVREDQ
jgi:hypothetical protein